MSKKTFTQTGAKQEQSIVLMNPVADHYATWVIGNAQYCDNVVQQNSHAGQTLVICGAGPSLRETAEVEIPKADVVWGCNSAGPWLVKRGYKCDAFYTVDQTSEMLQEWHTAPDVEYIVASTVHPHLVEYLLDRKRRITFHHNFVGMKRAPVGYSVCMDCSHTSDFKADFCDNCKSAALERGMSSYEDWLYMALYPGTVRAGSGLNTVTRAIDVAMFMGFAKIIVLGADCCLRVKSPCPQDAVPGTPEHRKWLEEETMMHADGGNALASNATPLTLGGVIDPGTKDGRIRRGKGVRFETKADLVISAVWLVHMERQSKGRIRLAGDGLPTALRKKSNAFLERLPTLVGSDGVPIQIKVA